MQYIGFSFISHSTIKSTVIKNVSNLLISVVLLNDDDDSENTHDEDKNA